MNRFWHLLVDRPGWAALLVVLLGAALPAAASAAVLPADITAVLSGTPDLLHALPTPVADASIGPRAVSSDGRTVAFTSASDGLLAGDDDGVVNTYAKDMATGAVQLVGRAFDGAPAHRTCGGDFAGGGDGAPAISADGRWVAFVCSDALIPADTNGLPDVYLRDLDLQTTTLVSRGSGDGPVGDKASTQPTVDATGEHVAWTSASGNLGGGGAGARTRVYRRTTTGTRATERFSPLSDTSGAPVAADAQTPSISGDGARIAFATAARLAPEDANTNSDVYLLRNTGANAATLLSRASGPAGDPGAEDSTDPQLSLDGSMVAFSSRAGNLVPADRGTGQDVYERQIDGPVAATTLISHTVAGAPGNGPSVAAGISETGLTVALLSKATDLDPADPDAGSDAYIARGLGAPVLAGRRDGTAGAAANTTGVAALSSDGDHLAVRTRGGLAGDDDPLPLTVSLRDLAAGRTRLVSRPQAAGPFLNEGGDAFDVSLSADGRFAAFVTKAHGLGLPDGVPRAVVVRDLETGAVTLASREDGPDGAPLTGGLLGPHLSADGSRVVFGHDAGTEHVLVRDLRTNRTLQADRADGPDGAPGQKDAGEATISDDGQRVAFASLSDNLVGGAAGNLEKIFVRDLATSRTILAGRADRADGALPDTGAEAPVISGDGRSVAFTTRASNLEDGDADATADVHVRRLDTGRTLLASATGTGLKGDADSRRPTISRDGTRVAFDSEASVFAGAVAGRLAVYVRDFTRGGLSIAGRADGPSGAPVSGDAFEALISADGGSVAFTARTATSAAPGAPGDGVRRIYLRQLAAGTTRLVTRASGSEGAPTGLDADIRAGAVTADGGCVAFGARGDLAPGGTVDFAQVFLRATTANCGRPVPFAASPPPPSPLPPSLPPPSLPGPPPPKAVDRTAPRLTGVKLSRTRLRVGAKPTLVRSLVAARAGSGTVLSLRSSEAARLSISVDRERPGRRTGPKHTCRATTQHAPKRPCTLRTRDGVLRRSLRGGAARFTLTGRIGTRRLALGRHRLTLVARDAAGNASRPVTLRFTLVR